MSTLLTCQQGHKWWEPFTDESGRPPGGNSCCPRCGAAVDLSVREPVAHEDQPAPIRSAAEIRMLNVDLKIADDRLHASIPVPAGPTRPIELLPAFHGLTEAIVEIGVRRVEAEGETISCKKGCGACCRQLVPVSEIEARYVRELVDAMPEPRRTQVRARFAKARELLQESGMLDKLRHTEQFTREGLLPLGLAYFAEGIPCPFLDEESCSIHLTRPAACREYLVTSPADNCARPTADTVHCVKLPAKVSSVLLSIGSHSSRPARWVPLVLALDWAETNSAEPPPRPGADIVREFFQLLVGPQNPLPGLGS